MPPPRRTLLIAFLIPCLGLGRLSAAEVASIPLHVGAAYAEFVADDSMIIAGGITAGKATGQEGQLRAVAVILEQAPFGKLVIVANDVLMMTRTHLDPVVAEIEKTLGIPASHVLINCTHTHHAPSTMVLHDYGLDDAFTRNVQRSISPIAPSPSQTYRATPCSSTDRSAISKR